MIRFNNDYNHGAHPEILEALGAINGNSYGGYGEDEWCEKAAELIREKIHCADAAVHFFPGATQANFIVTAAALSPVQSVIAADTGHINCHEAASIENTGHKVLTLPQHQGKIDAGELKTYLETFFEDGNHEHMVFPGMVYVSWPTEYGTLYSKAELEAIAEVCHAYEMPLYLDGARLGYGLMSPEADMTLPDIARICDVFYIGGTKVGALCGEAVVFPKGNAPKHFMTRIKQQGALLAKGRLLGIQFDELFTGNLYLNISRNAIEMAEQLKRLLHDKNYTFYLESPTNQQFVIMENEKLEELKKHVAVSFWEKADDTHTVVRLATGWSTTVQDMEELGEWL